MTGSSVVFLPLTISSKPSIITTSRHHKTQRYLGFPVFFGKSKIFGCLFPDGIPKLRFTKNFEMAEKKVLKSGCVSPPIPGVMFVNDNEFIIYNICTLHTMHIHIKILLLQMCSVFFLLGIFYRFADCTPHSRDPTNFHEPRHTTHFYKCVSPFSKPRHLKNPQRYAFFLYFAPAKLLTFLPLFSHYKQEIDNFPVSNFLQRSSVKYTEQSSPSYALYIFYFFSWVSVIFPRPL